MSNGAAIENLIGTGYYRDTGCEYSKSCLSCVLEICHYDVSYLQQQKNRFYKQVAEMVLAGFNTAYIAKHFGKTKRQIADTKQNIGYKRIAQ
tara:strand:- start:690 stop:965 length:276 start_codon:yes stop_codon:yes gene_type:complete